MMAERKEDMLWWASRKIDVHFRTIATLLALAVGAIGFIASHMLSSDHGQDGFLEIAPMLFSGLFLLISCANGLTGFVKLLEFCSSLTDMHAKYFRLATALLYEKDGVPPASNDRTDEDDTAPNFACFVWQRSCFSLGILALIAWVLVAYFGGANPEGTPAPGYPHPSGHLSATE